MIVAGSLLLTYLDRVDLAPDFLIYVVRMDSAGVPTGLGDILADCDPDLLRSLYEPPHRPAGLPLGLHPLDPNRFVPALRPYHEQRKPVTMADVVFVERRCNVEPLPRDHHKDPGLMGVARLTLAQHGNADRAVKDARATAERMWREGGDDGAAMWLGIAARIESIAAGAA